ncbi:MAG TPA: phospholipase D family protein, partial [Caldisericia bacterium]|nr:phospholipase D family protein [Caldisericia bacterium]
MNSKTFLAILATNIILTGLLFIALPRGDWGVFGAREETGALEQPSQLQNIEVFTEENSFAELEKLIKGAKKRIWIEMYELTDNIYKGNIQKPSIINLLQSTRKDLQISIIVDLEQEKTQMSKSTKNRTVLKNFEKEFEKNKKKEIRWFKSNRVFHRKVCIIDNDKLWIGSSNFTYSGINPACEEPNLEMNVRIIDKDIVEKVAKKIQQDWNNQSLLQ